MFQPPDFKNTIYKYGKFSANLADEIPQNKLHVYLIEPYNICRRVQNT